MCIIINWHIKNALISLLFVIDEFGSEYYSSNVPSTTMMLSDTIRIFKTD